MTKNRDDEFRIHIGRADQGRSFVRVIHVPTGQEMIVVGLGNRSASEIIQQLKKTILDRIDETLPSM